VKTFPELMQAADRAQVRSLRTREKAALWKASGSRRRRRYRRLENDAARLEYLAHRLRGRAKDLAPVFGPSPVEAIQGAQAAADEALNRRFDSVALQCRDPLLEIHEGSSTPAESAAMVERCPGPYSAG
jgi:hypothetical protein